MPEKLDEKYPRVNFRIAQLEKPMRDRARTGETLESVAKRDLERYYNMLTRTLAKIQLSEGEAMLICDVLNGSFINPNTVTVLWAEVQDAVRDGYAGKWEVNGKTLVEKLQNLTAFECMAIADAVERFWNAPTYHISDTSERLRMVGLIK